jgi:hypothetical protein
MRGCGAVSTLTRIDWEDYGKREMPRETRVVPRCMRSPRCFQVLAWRRRRQRIRLKLGGLSFEELEDIEKSKVPVSMFISPSRTVDNTAAVQARQRLTERQSQTRTGVAMATSIALSSIEHNPPRLPRDCVRSVRRRLSSFNWGARWGSDLRPQQYNSVSILQRYGSNWASVVNGWCLRPDDFGERSFQRHRLGAVAFRIY